MKITCRYIGIPDTAQCTHFLDLSQAVFLVQVFFPHLLAETVLP